MKTILKISLFCSLVILGACAFSTVDSPKAMAFAEEELYAAAEYDRAPHVKLEEIVSLNAAGLPLVYEGGDRTFKGFEFWENNRILEMNFCLEDSETCTEDYDIFFAGSSAWNSYNLKLNYARNTVALESAGGNVKKSKPFSLEYGAEYNVSLCLIDLYDNSEHIGDPVGDRVAVSITNGLERAEFFYDFVGNERNGFVQNAGTGRTHYVIGFQSESNTVAAAFLPCDFQRDYRLILHNGERIVVEEIAYGAEYDFTGYAPQKPMYDFVGYRAEIDGKEVTLPAKGIWKQDIEKSTAGIYTADLYPEYRAIEYGVTYAVAHATLPAETPTKITAEKPFELPIPETDSGYVFFGWYLDSGYTNSVDHVVCTGEAVSLYGKTAEGFTLTLLMPDGTVRSVPNETGASYSFPIDRIKGYGEISGWEKQSGETWEAVSGNSIIVSEDATFRAIAEKENYTLTYNLSGGTNHQENPNAYTVTDEVVFKTPSREGYLFVGFQDATGASVSGLPIGTTGNQLLTALWWKESLPSEKGYILTSSPQALPVFVVPETAFCTVSLVFGQEAIEVENGRAVFPQAGEYQANYRVTLLGGGVVERSVKLVVTQPKIELVGEYQAKYTAGEKLNLIDAYTADVSSEVSVTVYKNGEKTDYGEYSLTLEEGEYKVVYALQGAESIERTFTVEKGAPQNKGNGLAPWAIALIVVGCAVVVAAVAGITLIVIKKKKTKNGEKDENGKDKV